MEPGYTGNGVPDAAGKEEICRRVTFQLLVLTGILAGAALCCLSFLSLEDPAFFDVLNHSADKVNEIHKTCIPWQSGKVRLL